MTFSVLKAGLVVGLDQPQGTAGLPGSLSQKDPAEAEPQTHSYESEGHGLEN